MAGLLLAPVLVVVLVVAGYVYLSGRHAPAPSHSAPPSHPAAAPNSPAPTLGPWKHIESRSQDAVPLTISELFPAKFTADGQSGTLTVSKEGTKCTHEVIGSKLAKAVRKADCTQVLRASYLSTDRKIMATVGVLNLADATEAGKAGKAAGAVEFIKQLASKHGPTRNIAKGTGIVAAYVKGHYLILTWTEFANLHAPSGKTKRKQLEAFSTGLVAGTANVSLTSRMVTGHPCLAYAEGGGSAGSGRRWRGRPGRRPRDSRPPQGRARAGPPPARPGPGPGPRAPGRASRRACCRRRP